MPSLTEMPVEPPFKSHRLEVSASLWLEGAAQLRQRAAGFRESGAFLLGRQMDRVAVIEQFVYYDDLDPGCLHPGYIQFDGRKLGLLWKICRDTNLDVVADVHVHPGRFTQSETDRENPMIPSKGHLAIIIPDFAKRNIMPDSIGFYEYQGGKSWIDLSRSGASLLKVTP